VVARPLCIIAPAEGPGFNPLLLHFLRLFWPVCSLPIDRPRVQLFCPLPQAFWSPAASTKQFNPVPAEHMELFTIPAALWQRELARTVPHRAAVRGLALCAYLFPLLLLRVTASCYASLSQPTVSSFSTFLQQAHSLGSPFLPLSLGAAPVPLSSC
jgi:hypothetical protein